MDMLRNSLGQLKVEANSVDFESSVREAVLCEIEELESLWEASAEAIDRIRDLSISPEKEWRFRSEEALAKVAAFEERICEIRGN
jgi:hypothetical protein